MPNLELIFFYSIANVDKILQIFSDQFLTVAKLPWQISHFLCTLLIALFLLWKQFIFDNDKSVMHEIIDKSNQSSCHRLYWITLSPPLHMEINDCLTFSFLQNIYLLVN